MLKVSGLIDFARDYILFMSIAMLAGGIMGYVKASSKASLISGVISALLLGGSFIFAINGKIGVGFISSFIIYSILDLVFVMRLIKTRKFMPAGMILLLCMTGQVLAIAAHRAMLGSANYRE